ncbi:MAG TPA: hypothetical protein VHL33_07980, partial [Casimicrobiaceae bacterium]|nr:hypothetical protein [Casimicrobiaceae bacterium]
MIVPAMPSAKPLFALANQPPARARTANCGGKSRIIRRFCNASETARKVGMGTEAVVNKDKRRFLIGATSV